MGDQQDRLIVPGFTASAVEANIRYQGRLDLGLIVSDTPAVAAGVFTTSLVKAAPVLLDLERLAAGRAQAILVNSGVANACTGEAGMELARASAGAAAAVLGLDEELVLVASTGVIGEVFDPDRIAARVERLRDGLEPAGLEAVARAMMTTDTVPKTARRTVEIEGRPVTIAGLAKGAGMIMPDMATMLCFVLTDAVMTPEVARTMLRQGVAGSFNRITVDGDTSTNDTVLLLANGRAGHGAIVPGSPAGTIFQQALDGLCRDLALQIVRDGEGAGKLVTVRVEGARSESEALTAARTIANSLLVKTAFFGEDANWGRIVAAAGRSGAEFDPGRVDILFDDLALVRDGLALGREAEKRAASVLGRDEFTVTVNLKAGGAASEIYTCDLSLDYVRINADYRS